MEKLYESLDELLNECTVRINVKGGHGTGFFVAPGLVLTCAHVIKDVQKQNTTVTVYSNFNQQIIQVGPVSEEDVFPDPYPDLALLRVDVHDHPCVFLGTEYSAFADFYSYGYTKDHPDGESTTVECEGTQEDGGTLIKLKEGQVKPGSSGSPLLNKKTGYVCGMIARTRNRLSDLGGVGIPVRTIFANFAEVEKLNWTFHQRDTRWSSLLEKEQQIKRSNSVVAVLYNESKKIQRPKHFVGREEILTEVSSLLDQSCRVLLTGMAGIGKTALAQVLAQHCVQNKKGEVLWVEIKDEKPDAVIEALANCLGDSEISQLNHLEEKIPVLTGVLEQSKVGLIVLENVHNVASADTVTSIIPEKIPVLITSRQRYVVDKIVEVNVLSLPEALKILEKTTGISHLSESADAVSLCEQLGYHPYALELAGSMMRELDRTPKELRRRLAGAPLDLSSSTRGRLRALLDDSAANLDANTRSVLFDIGVFPSNGVTANLLAAYLNKAVEDIYTSLDELIKRNLVKRRPDTEFYFMHDLTFYYVRSQAEPDNEEEWQTLVEGMIRYLENHRYEYNLLGLDLPNLLSIAGLLHGVELVQLVSYLTIGNFPLQEGKSYADQRGYSIGLIDQLDRAIEVARSLGKDLKTTTHYLLGKRGNAAFRRGDYELAAEKYKEELLLSPSNERRVMIGSIFARTLAFCGQIKESSKQFEVANKLAEKFQDDDLRGFVLEQESWAAGHLKDYKTALRVAEKQLALAEALYKKDSQTYEAIISALNNFGSAKLDLGKETHSEVSSVLEIYEKAKTLAENHSDYRLLADIHNSLGEYFHYVEDRNQAKSNFERALHIWHSLEMTQREDDLQKLMRDLGYSD